VAHVKLAADTEVTFHFAMPGGETPRFGECRPND
jgi:hypothetical protein